MAFFSRAPPNVRIHSRAPTGASAPEKILSFLPSKSPRFSYRMTNTAAPDRDPREIRQTSRGCSSAHAAIQHLAGGHTGSWRPGEHIPSPGTTASGAFASPAHKRARPRRTTDCTEHVRAGHAKAKRAAADGGGGVTNIVATEAERCEDVGLGDDNACAHRRRRPRSRTGWLSCGGRTCRGEVGCRGDASGGSRSR